eukprot:5593730-Pleurochrysis_carterae.AAC.3
MTWNAKTSSDKAKAFDVQRNSFCCPAQPSRRANRDQPEFGADVMRVQDWTQLRERFAPSRATKQGCSRVHSTRSSFRTCDRNQQHLMQCGSWRVAAV